MSIGNRTYHYKMHLLVAKKQECYIRVFGKSEESGNYYQ